MPAPINAACKPIHFRSILSDHIIFNKSVQNVLNQTVFFAEESNVQYVLANTTRFGISPICMIRKGVPSEVIFLRMISKYCNSKGFDLMLPAFREFNVLDTCNIQTSFAFASSFSFMASTWDAKTGYQISLEAEKIFFKSTRILFGKYRHSGYRSN
jgi:hypothetical protein